MKKRGILTFALNRVCRDLWSYRYVRLIYLYIRLWWPQCRHRCFDFRLSLCLCRPRLWLGNFLEVGICPYQDNCKILMFFVSRFHIKFVYYATLSRSNKDTMAWIELLTQECHWNTKVTIKSLRRNNKWWKD